MKTIKFYMLIGAALLLASCSDDFLDVQSKTESNTGNFYKTVSDANRALIGCYDGWQRTGTSGTLSFYMASEVMADECFGGTGNRDGYNFRVVDRFDIVHSQSDLNVHEELWSAYYAGIYRCNELIAHEGQIDWKGNDELQGKLTGECRALRAIMYFDLVRMFGNIPLLKEPTDANVPQANPDEVYALIVEDLKYAAANIPEDAYPKAQAKTNDGRITKYAAAALLARVYLYYTGYYEKDIAGVTKAEVLAGLEDVIASGEFGLVDEFKNLWVPASTRPSPKPATPTGDYAQDWDTDYAGDGNKETILAQKFNYAQNYYNGDQNGNRWLVMMGIRSFTYSPYGNGWGACTVNPKLWNAFAAGDTRKAASIIDHVGEGIAAEKDYEKNHVGDQREYTGYTVKKYTPMAYSTGQSGTEGLGTNGFQEGQFQDFVVMRYADVLLMAAELGAPTAQAYYDEVRTRAGLASRTATPANITEERRFEFAFEGQRYWDLLRQGVTAAATAIAETNTSVKEGGNPGTLTIDAQSIIAKQGLSQIPQNQITLSNGVLTQNAGW